MKPLLRVMASGSVDDGKSTLIGRLLHDTNALHDDQLRALERATQSRGSEGLNLAYVTDGLKDERARGITIDVAYRYFATATRKFILADVPGHVELTRNMVTAASTADLAIVLVDITLGLLEQTRRHAYLASLLRIPRLVVCLNKMDLVDFSEDAFKKTRDSFSRFAAALSFDEISYIPLSALKGDNVVSRSKKMPWYQGSTLLEYLDEVEVGSARHGAFTRVGIQLPLGKAYAATVLSGVVKKGDELIEPGSGRVAKIASLAVAERSLAEAASGRAITLTFERPSALKRGDLLAPSKNPPRAAKTVDLMLCWLGEQPLQSGAACFAQHATRRLGARVIAIQHKLDIDTQKTIPGVSSLSTNEIARATLELDEPLYFDAYAENRATGCLALIDENGNTVGAGLLL